MKEAFEKIKERLEAIWVDNRCGDCVYKSVCDKVQEEAIVNDQTDLCGVTIKAVALSIVSEVEAEYGNYVCEWKNEKGMFIQNPHTGRKFSNEPSMKNVYCNTCGKKIKVVE